MNLGKNCKSVMEGDETKITSNAIKIISAVETDNSPVMHNDGTFSFIDKPNRPYKKLFNYSENEVIFHLEIVGRKVT